MARRKNKKTVTTDILFYQKLLQDSNIQAYLKTIRKGEGTLGVKGYSTLVGGERFNTFIHHPNIYKPKYKSTAAGAYQFLYSTWSNDAKALRLIDFTPNNQDIAALYEINKAGALYDVLNGNIESAINKTNRVWVSLPGAKHDAVNKYSQRLENAISFYKTNGGVMHNTSEATQLNLPSFRANLTENIGTYPLAVTIADKTRTVRPIQEKSLLQNNPNVNFRDMAVTDIIPIAIKLNSLNPTVHGADDTGNRGAGEKVSNNKSEKLPKIIEHVQPPAISPDQIMRNIFIDHPTIKSKWGSHPLQNSNSGFLLPPDIQDQDLEQTQLDAGSLFSIDKISSIVGVNTKYILSLSKDGLAYGDENTSGKYPNALKNNNNEKAVNGNLSNEIGASYNTNGKSINIHLNKPMIDHFTINVKDAKEGINNLKYQVEEMLLEVLNSANAIQ